MKWVCQKTCFFCFFSFFFHTNRIYFRISKVSKRFKSQGFDNSTAFHSILILNFVPFQSGLGVRVLNRSYFDTSCRVLNPETTRQKEVFQ